MIQAKNIQLKIAQQTILNVPEMTLMPGEVVVLLGANGAGKSSLLHILAGSSEHAFELDELVYDGDANLTLLQLAKRRAVLSQQSVVPFELRLLEVVEMGHYRLENLDQSQSEAIICKALALADVSHLAQRQFMSLSGGEQQRAQFARVLAQLLGQQIAQGQALESALEYKRKQALIKGLAKDPEQGNKRGPGLGQVNDQNRSQRGQKASLYKPSYLFLDEPLTGLDPKHQQALLHCVQQISQQYMIGVLMVLHDINWAAYYADRIVLLKQGKIVAEGTPEQALTESNLEQVFGLSAHLMRHPLNAKKLFVVWHNES